jgi:hypothetical protein
MRFLFRTPAFPERFLDVRQHSGIGQKTADNWAFARIFEQMQD